METAATKQAREKSINPAVLSASERHLSQVSAPQPLEQLEKKAAGYGLPCSHCHAYYPADMRACPICKSTERVSPTARVIHSTVPAAAQPAPKPAIDDERERFLKELKSQAFASHTQINTAATFRCVLEHQHTGATSQPPFAIAATAKPVSRPTASRPLCRGCQGSGEIVYDVVSADTSDPDVASLNADKRPALRVRKRAGIGLLLGANKPLAR